MFSIVPSICTEINIQNFLAYFSLRWNFFFSFVDLPMSHRFEFTYVFLSCFLSVDIQSAICIFIFQCIQYQYTKAAHYMVPKGAFTIVTWSVYFSKNQLVLILKEKRLDKAFQILGTLFAQSLDQIYVSVIAIVTFKYCNGHFSCIFVLSPFFRKLISIVV